MNPLPIRIDRESPVPVHSQIDAQLTQLITSGALQRGERLPTVRDLGTALGVNRNTVQKVYRELERSGLLEARTGKGTYVAAAAATDTSKVRQRAHQRVRALVQEVFDLGFDAAEITAMVQLEATRLAMDRARQAEGLAASRQRFATWGRYRARDGAPPR